MFTRRASDEAWIKYLLATGLVTVDQLQAMRGNQNQFDICDLLCRHAGQFESGTWLNNALQQDRFHYIPQGEIQFSEIEELRRLHPLLVARCLNDGILPLSYAHQVVYLGILRYDPEFPELKEILTSVPPEIAVCLTPVAPKEYTRLNQKIRALAKH
jgi:hypothetical protein